MAVEAYIPSELIIDMDDNKANRALLYTPELAHALPGLPEAFEQANQAYEANRDAQFENLEQSVFHFELDDAPVIFSLRYSAESARSKDISVMAYGFADHAPHTSAARILNYIGLEKPGLIDKQLAMPNTWSSIVKTAAKHDTRQALGLAIPELAIYRPLPFRAYTFEEQQAIRDGDFSPYAKVIKSAVAQAQNILHGPHSETQISGVHLHGISLGASEVIGGGAGLKHEDEQLEVKSVTSQELIMGLNLIELAKFGGTVGEPSRQQAALNDPRIPEPTMRAEVDKFGNEASMIGRNVWSSAKLAVRLGQGLPHPEVTTADIDYLAGSGVPVTVGLAKNSYASHRTAEHLPVNDNVKVVTIDTVEGRTIAHISNEHVGGLVALSLLGIRRATT